VQLQVQLVHRTIVQKFCQVHLLARHYSLMEAIWLRDISLA
jgi:hypothetical protein